MGVFNVDPFIQCVIYRYLYVEGRLVKNNMDLYTGTYMWKVISNSDDKYSIVVGDII